MLSTLPWSLGLRLKTIFSSLLGVGGFVAGSGSCSTVRMNGVRGRKASIISSASSLKMAVTACPWNFVSDDSTRPAPKGRELLRLLEGAALLHHLGAGLGERLLEGRVLQRAVDACGVGPGHPFAGEEGRERVANLLVVGLCRECHLGQSDDVLAARRGQELRQRIGSSLLTSR